jgi:hypothetical protein
MHKHEQLQEGTLNQSEMPSFRIESVWVGANSLLSLIGDFHEMGAILFIFLN